MHILYIHQHFATPKGSTGTRSYEFARRWVKAGHKVTLITGNYDIGGLELDKALFQIQNVEGINIVVVGTKYSNKQTHLRRIISFLSFCLFSIYAGLRTKKIDIIYATSTPLTVGIPAIVLKLLKRIPFVFEVRDQWPEIPIELSILKNKIMIKLLLWLEKIIYKQSSAIVTLSPGTADNIRKIMCMDGSQIATTEIPITVIPNSSDIDFFRPDIDGSAVRKTHRWDGNLVLLHFGAMGKANGLNFVIDAAQRLNSNADIRFVLAGDGYEKQILLEKAKTLELKNIDILDSMSKLEMSKFVAACDVAIVIVANHPILENNSANKFFDSLSAGKAVLLNYSGWQRKIIEDNDAGFGCSLSNLDEFVEKVLYLNSHRNLIEQMGQNARRVALEKFDRNKLAVQALSVLESTLN